MAVKGTVFKRIYKHSGKEVWCINVSHDEGRIRKAIGSRRDAENALFAVLTDIRRGEFNLKTPKKISFEDFAEKYLEQSKLDKKLNSYIRDVSSFNHLIPYFEGMSLAKITPKHIDGYKKERLASEIKVRLNKKKLDPGTINRELDALQAMFTLANKWGDLEGKNPVKAVNRLPMKERPMRILKKDEIDELIKVATGITRALIIIALYTAMRKNEILNLRWKDIDFVGSFIHIGESKSNKVRKIPMNSVVRNTIKEIKREGEFIFHNPKTGMRIRDFYRSWKTVREDAGVPDLRFHDLRHTAATLMVQGGIDLVTVRDILGHANIRMTVKYAHSTPESMVRAVNVLADMIEAKYSAQCVTNLSRQQCDDNVNN
jgi:integrase